MQKYQLIDELKQLTVSSVPSINAYSKKLEVMIAKLNQSMINNTYIQSYVPSKHIDIMSENHQNHARFMVSMMNDFQPAIFIDTVIWAYTTYHQRGFDYQYWLIQFNTWIDIIQQELDSQTSQEIITLYKWMINNHPHFIRLTEQSIQTQQVKINQLIFT